MNHIYSGERCIFCNVNSYDVAIYYDDEICESREGNFVYSTETGDKGPTDYRFKEQYDAFGFKLDLSNVQEGYDLVDGSLSCDSNNEFYGENI